MGNRHWTTIFVFSICLGAYYRLLSFCLRFLGCIGENGLKLKIKSLHYDFTSATTFLPPSISITGLEAGYVWLSPRCNLTTEFMYIYITFYNNIIKCNIYIYMHTHGINVCITFPQYICMCIYIQTDLQYVCVYIYTLARIMVDLYINIYV